MMTPAAITDRHVVLTFVRFGDALHVMGSSNATWTGLRRLGTFTPDWRAIEAICRTTRHLIEHAADAGEFSLAAVDELRRNGTWLFDELLPGDARRWLRDHDGLLTLHLDPMLLNIPWELLHTSHEFVSLQWALGRVVAIETEPATRQLPAHSNRSVLVIADPAEHLIEAFNEGQALQNFFVRQGRIDVDLRATCVDADLLRRHIRDYDILHFAGHIDGAGWEMNSSRFGASHLERLTGGAALPALVFANGCGGTASGASDGDMVMGWLEGGVRHLLGPLFDVPDRLGRAFAIRFYRSLLGGAPIGIAVRDARRGLTDEFGVGTVPWGSYVLYGAPETRYATCNAFESAAPPRIVRQPTRLSPDRTPVDAEVTRRAADGIASPTPRSRRNLVGWTIGELVVLGSIVAFAAVVRAVLRLEPMFGPW